MRAEYRFVEFHMEEINTMEEQPQVSSDDRLWAALGYPIPLIPIIILLMEDKKNVPFLRYHAIQSIALNILLWVVMVVLGITIILSLCAPLVWLVTLWPAYDSFKGNYTELPVVTNFLKGQGWI
jgi:uncharacterized membrane protein